MTPSKKKRGIPAVDEMMSEHGDVKSRWRLRFAGTQEWIDGSLSKALLRAAYLTAEYHDVEIADSRGPTTLFLRG